ncbi:MAG TPA: response regulator [Pseudonocardiaceae bacterium]|jgi:two-component system nitrate/nitrite response regulator NarL|nr:response regulator [Pseudonocardiaceae bacterium]
MPRTVLIVDDDPGFRRIATHLLTTRGFQVVAAAEDAAQALAAAREYQPDCVLLDLNLSGDNGLSVAQAITGSPPVPSVVLTSTDPSGFAAPVLAASGIRAFVAKDRLAGVDLDELFSSASS